MELNKFASTLSAIIVYVSSIATVVQAPSSMTEQSTFSTTDITTTDTAAAQVNNQSTCSECENYLPFRNAKSAYITVVKYRYTITPPIVIVGMLCNLCILTTLNQPELRTPKYMYLTSLTISDLLALSVELINFLYVRLDIPPYCAKEDLVLFYIYVYYPVMEICKEFGVYVLVLMAMESVVELQFPLRSQTGGVPFSQRKGRRTVKTKVLLLATVVVVTNTPLFLWYQQTEITGASVGAEG